MIAEFSQNRSDMYWKVHDMKDGFIRWGGYDDDNWWRNVAPKTRVRVGPVTGNKYTIDYDSGQVTVEQGSPATTHEGTT